jgi:nitroreductase
MDVREAIHTRRSIGRMLPEAPPRAVIERLLEAAVLAPNHHHTQPWRFFVLTGDARAQLGAAQEAALRRSLADPDDPKNAALLAKERAKPFRSPVVIVVAVEPSTDPKVVGIEEVCATAAAVQNLLLAAHGEGLAAMWRTGETAYDAGVRELFGLSERAQVLGIIYLGYADPAQPPAPRVPRRDRTTWIGWPGPVPV